MASIHTDLVSAHDATRMLAPGGNVSQLGDALAHYGRIFKTLHVLRKVDTSGTITNFAGSPFATSGNTGDGGLPISATLNAPSGVAVDAAGDVYIADQNNNRVREVLPSNSVPVIRPAPALMIGTGLVLVLVGLGVRAARRRTDAITQQEDTVGQTRISKGGPKR